MFTEKNIETKERMDIRRLYYNLKKYWISREYGYLLFGRYSTWSFEDVIFISKGPFVIEISVRRKQDSYSVNVTANAIDEKECNAVLVNTEIEKVARFIKSII